jgi:hypothetical protein
VRVIICEQSSTSSIYVINITVVAVPNVVHDYTARLIKVYGIGAHIYVEFLAPTPTQYPMASSEHLALSFTSLPECDNNQPHAEHCNMYAKMADDECLQRQHWEYTDHIRVTKSHNVNVTLFAHPASESGNEHLSVVAMPYRVRSSTITSRSSCITTNSVCQSQG